MGAQNNRKINDNIDLEKAADQIVNIAEIEFRQTDSRQNTNNEQD